MAVYTRAQCERSMKLLQSIDACVAIWRLVFAASVVVRI